MVGGQIKVILIIVAENLRHLRPNIFVPINIAATKPSLTLPEKATLLATHQNNIIKQKNTLNIISKMEVKK